MAKFIIHGQKRLSGTIKPMGNKNAALPMIAAALLTDEAVTLNNLPEIEDVQVMLSLLEGLGASVSRVGSQVTICAKTVNKRELDPALCQKVRGSILLAGPLAARFGKAVLAHPGGDVIGRRRLDMHYLVLEALGLEFHSGHALTIKRKKLCGVSILMDEASVTATENAMMVASIAEGRSIIYNAACEPHVCDLGRLLQAMGARIEGLGTNRLVIDGVSALHGAEMVIGPDHIEVGSYLAAAAVTGGELTINLPKDCTWLPVVEKAFGKMGITWNYHETGLTMPARQRRLIKRDLIHEIPKIEDGIWPSFPSDLMSVTIVLATQVRGMILFFEKLFESRMYFVDNLITMGAGIVQCDPHRVVVVGPTRLRGARMATPDIRAGMALLIAALCAKGESVIENAQIIDRGYERVEQRLQALGADIVRAD